MASTSFAIGCSANAIEGLKGDGGFVALVKSVGSESRGTQRARRQGLLIPDQSSADIGPAVAVFVHDELFGAGVAGGVGAVVLAAGVAGVEEGFLAGGEAGCHSREGCEEQGKPASAVSAAFARWGGRAEWWERSSCPKTVYRRSRASAHRRREKDCQSNEQACGSS